MLEDFDASDIGTGGSSVFLRRSGSGPPLLLLHGFPQTHLMWRGVAPLLARRFTVVCADLRGYGRSGCPAWRRTTPLTRNAPWRGRSRR
jgi:haloacetate dehalogenase